MELGREQELITTGNMHMVSITTALYRHTHTHKVMDVLAVT